MNRSLYPLLLVALISACTTRAPVEISSGTQIGDLKTTDSTTSPTPAETPSSSETLNQYDALLAEEEDPQQRALLAQRAANLRMDEAGAEATAPDDWRETIALLENSLSPEPGRAGNDEILYQMARSYELAGQSEASIAQLTRIIEEHPQSGLYAEALFRRAEKRFALGQYRTAEHDYIRVLAEQKTNQFDEPSRHKLAWAIFKQGRYREALNKLLSLLDEELTPARLSADGSQLQLDDLDSATRTRLTDSVRVTILSYALIGGAKAIPATLRGHPQHYRALLYLELSDLYKERGHHQVASDILKQYISTHPADAAVLPARQRMIALLEDSGDQSSALAARARFVMSKLNSEDAETRALVRKDLGLLTRHYHAQAQAGDTAAYQQARQWYRRLLQAFPDEHEQRYLYAELMLDKGDNPDAARQFERLGYDTPGFSKAREAAYASLLARRKSGQASAQAAARFTKAFPNHKEASNILAGAAESQFEAGNYREAISEAQKVLDRNPAHSQALTMLSLQTHAYAALEEHAKTEIHAKRWLKRQSSKHRESDNIKTLLAQSIYRQAQSLTDQPAVDKLLQIRSLAPANNSDLGKLRASASLQAAQIQLDAKRWPEAASILEELRRAFPNHPQQADIAKGLALAYEGTGDKKRAAAEYSRFSKATDDPTQRRVAAYQTAELHWQAGRLEAARDAFRDYANHYSQPLDPLLQAQSRLARIYAKLKDDRESFWLKKIVETDAKAGSQRNDISRSLAANASLRLADIDARSYRRTALRMPLEKGIQRKQAALETALAAYGKAADYRIAEVTTAASYQIAELYRDFGRSLLHAPIPKATPAEERETLEILLEEQAFPFEEKAIQIHETNISRFEQGLFDDWVSKSLTALMELVPGKYAKREQGTQHAETL